VASVWAAFNAVAGSTLLISTSEMCDRTMWLICGVLSANPWTTLLRESLA
jgi:hypothetical protein